MDNATDQLRSLLEFSGLWLSKFAEWNQTQPLRDKFLAALQSAQRRQELLQEKFNEDVLLPDMETRVLFHNLSCDLFLCFSNYPEKYGDHEKLSFYRYLTETQVVLLGL